MGDSQNYGYLFGGPYNKDYSILGFILGSPYLGLRDMWCRILDNSSGRRLLQICLGVF